ncbi:replicative DNA helicase [Microtetraspora malaysiensis]|uniref:replicative DNA helicase n=1 Tax=Microtetraspora malaysiensis TaxID=161358 RepID=UPI003D92CE45
MTAEVFETFERAEPHNIEAEQSILGGLLIGQARHVDEAAAIVQPGDFYRPGHRDVFETILGLHRDGERADPVTVLDRLTKNGGASGVDGAYLHTLMSTVPTPENITYYARIVKGLAVKRNLIAVGSQVVRFGYSGDPDDVDELVGEAVRKLTEQDASDDEAAPVGEGMIATLDWLESGKGSDGRVPLPYRDLDKLLGGLKPGQMAIIGARPAVGKSVVALDVARHVAVKAGLPVYLASLEMSKHELNLRLLAAEAKVNLHTLQDEEEEVTSAQWDRLNPAFARISESPLFIDDEPNVTVDRLRAQLRRMARRATGPARLVVVDYLQLMRSPNGGRRTPENRQVEVSEMSRNLKLLAREFGVPVVVLSQLNRGVEMRADKRPQISDLRESGSLEQDADVVILLHRDDDPETGRPGEMDLIVGKNRNGPTGTVSVAFQGHYARAADMAKVDSSITKRL